ncbi:MAG TPA: sigma-70 family RNA polymerase sigma factor [Dehalococcoidia bacterium]|nr:sigma-70 family RNA polymerase sigma factor [Dehalococcoidia bacterium]
MDGDAWEQIYTRNHPLVYRYVLARAGDVQTAEDIAAMVFAEAVKRIGSYEERGQPLLAWLYGIARNLTNQHHRSNFRRRQIAPETPLDSARDEPWEHSWAEDAIEWWDLRNAILKLSADQREAVILRFLAGLTTPEVATLLGKNERAVYSLYTRALRSLRRLLGEDFVESRIVSAPSDDIPTEDRRDR